MPSIQITSWEMLPSEGGGSLTIAGDRMAVGGSARLSVWQGDTRIASVDAPSPAPGTPRFVGNRVYWGPGVVDLPSGKYTLFVGAQPAIRPERGERPQVYTWSPQGDRLLGSFSTGDPICPVRVTLFNGQTGTAVATLWEGSGLPPQAAWLGTDAVVVGFGDPRVFDHTGKYLGDIALGGATIAAIEATTDERRLIAIDLNRTIAWIDSETWTVLDRWSGPWLHGTVSPDGRFVAVLEPWGKLHFACLEGDRFKPIGQAPCDPNAVALALTLSEIATVGSGEVRWASLRIDCATGDHQ